MGRDGCFAVVVGPDGVGKTTFAEILLARYPGDARYFHYRPPLAKPLATRVPAGPPLPKNRVRGSLPMGWLRLLIAIPRFWLGYLTSVRPALCRGSLVLGDRWAYGYLAQPLSVRFAGPEILARGALAVLPKPDVVFNLHAPVSVIRARKVELTEDEIGVELAAWRSIPGRIVDLDATLAPETLAEQALAVLGS